MAGAPAVMPVPALPVVAEATLKVQALAALLSG
jgi:hypothetical protein